MCFNDEQLTNTAKVRLYRAIEESDIEKGEEVFPSLMLVMSLSGTFYNPDSRKKDFISFLCDLENIARAMDATSIDFESYKYAVEGQDQHFTYHLTIKVYYQ